MVRLSLHTVCAVLALLSSGATSRAQVVLFTNPGSFQAATSGLKIIDFNDQIPAGSTSRGYANGTVTLAGVTFTSNNQRLFTVAPAFDRHYNLGDGPVLHWEGTWPRILTINLPANTTAVGMDFGADGAAPFDFALSTGETFTLTGCVTPTSSPTFAGFTSVAPISSLSVTVSEHVIITQIDRFSFGARAAVPEPGALALLTGAACFAANLLLRRQKQSQDRRKQHTGKTRSK